jgi:hypothetical protein
VLNNRLTTISARVAFGCAWVAAPFACAHGLESSLDSTLAGNTAGAGVGGMPVTTETGSGPTGGAGGSAGAVTSTGSAGTTTLGSGGGAGATGTGGNAGSTGGGGAAGSAAGGSGKGGAGGSSGGSGGGGRGGSAGAGGNGGRAGGGGNAGAGGAMPRPTGITLAQTAVPSGQQLTLTTSGTTFTQRCAQNEVVIGYTGTVEAPGGATNWLRSFRAVCGSLSIAGTTTYTVNTTQTATLAAHGQPQAVALTAMCGANQMIVGFGTRTGGAIDQFTFLCAPLTIAGTTPNFMLSVGPQTMLPAIGGPGGTPNGPIQCPAGQIAVGDEGREGTAIEAFGLLCARPTLVVQ